MSRDGRLLNREEEDESFEDGGVELGYARIPGEEDREEGSSFRIAGRSSRGGEEKERLARSARRDGEEDREG